MSEVLSIIETAVRPAASRTSLLGEQGETLAREHLVNNGCRIVVSNFKVPVGRNSRGVQVTGEIDIIALDGGTIVFVEVKTRRSDEFAPIATAVDLRKQRQIARTARIYRRLFDVFEMPYRYDVITVLIEKHAGPTVEHRNAFWTDASFKKRRWYDGGWYDR